MNAFLSQRDLLDYEVAAAPWVGYISWEPLQALAGKYFAWKVRRKYARYRAVMHRQTMLATQYPELFRR